MRARIPGLICVFVLCGILAAGLTPFRSPRNEVTWLGDKNGLRFARYATIFSDFPFQFTSPQDVAACSLEIWLQPALAGNSSTLLSFSSPENPLQFTVHQSGSELLLKREIHDGQDRAAVAGVRGVFAHVRPIFIAITSGASGTAVYVDGAVSRTFPQFQFQKDCRGRLVVGTSPVEDDGWLGQLRGLAIYRTELAMAQVLQHFQTWTTQGQPQLSGDERVAALYLFNERSGRVVRNAVPAGVNLYIPERYSLVHEVFLKPFWKEFEPGVSYWRDISLNIMAFIPLGFFFCFYWSSVRPLKRPELAAAVFGFAVSLAIEVLQSQLPTRNSGTTDLFTNTLGTLIGVRLYASKIAQGLLVKFLPVGEEK